MLQARRLPFQEDDFFERVMQTVGEEYVVVGSGLGDDALPLACSLVEMKLLVLVRRELLPFISAVRAGQC